MIDFIEEKDISIIADYAKEFEKESDCFKSIGGIDKDFFEINLFNFYKNNLLKVWKVFDNNNIFGFLGCLESIDIMSNKKCLAELFWFVLPKFRGKIENLKLLDVVLNYCKNNNIYYFQMIHLFDLKNEKLEKFYIKKGFKIMQKTYIKEVF